MRFEKLEEKLSGLIDHPDELSEEDGCEPTAKRERRKADKLSVEPEAPSNKSDKFEMLVFALILGLIVVVAFAVSVLALKKWGLRLDQENNLQASEEIVDGRVVYTNQVEGYKFSYPEAWNLAELEEGVYRFADGGVVADLVMLETGAFLRRQKHQEVSQMLQEYCSRYRADQARCPDEIVDVARLVLPGGTEVEQTLVDMHFAQTQRQQLTVYFWTIDNERYDTVVLIEGAGGSLEEIETIAESFEVL